MRGGFLKRIVLFIATNLAVLLVLGIVLRVFGIESYLERSGTGLNYTSLLIYSAVIGFTGAFISLALSKWMAKQFTGARVIAQPRSATEVWLVDTVRRLSREAGIGMPEVAIYDSPDPNAFATGARRDHALLAVSTGLLQSMNEQEVEAVLGHEVAHAANGDMITLTLLQGVLNTFVFFLSRVIGYAVDKTIFRSEREHGPGFWITSIVMQLLLGVLASLIVMWFARRRELRADHGSAQMLGPTPMIAALERLAGAHGPAMLPDTIRNFGIRGEGFSRLFSSHPPIEERIARLRELQLHGR